MRRLWVGLGLLSMGAALLPASLSQASATVADEGSYTKTQTITRVHQKADGTDQVIAESTVKVTADHTTELRGRERVHITWSGARPSGGRASNPYGESGLTQEYPVVVLQCRGVDDATLPEAKQLRPETCWTTTSIQRSVVAPHRTAVWRHDRHEPEGDRAERSGVEPFPEAECDVPSTAIFSARFTPFIAADGTQYLACDALHMPPEAAVGASFAPAELAAFSNEDGSGEIDFEVRSAVENASLGCSRKVACAIVVIPIMGISCLDTDAECRRNGTFIPGSSNFEGAEPHAAVSPRYWWSESNWRNRFTIPIKFGLPPDTCEVLDSRAPVGFYGSELLSQAALQWSPAYCLNEKRFKFQHNRMPDDGAFTLMSSGTAVAALVSGPQEQRAADPIGFAPTAVTGFGIGYVIDKPDNAGEYTRLRLNARLLAKLLTQSYPASELGRGHPGMAKNPLTLNRDPEFKRLNPGLDDKDREAAATVLSLSNSSDVIETLTGYIASDAAAMAFISGKPDPWGMKVNPSYKDIEVPRREWPLLDEFIPAAQPGTCRFANNDAPYLSQVAAPVTFLRTIAEALIDAWPNVQTTCEGPLAGGVYKTGRVSRQPVGQRFMLGIVSLGDASRFGLRTAALETKANKYVGATDESLSRGVALAEQTSRRGPFLISQEDVRKDGRAYPGTMVVYTAARLRGLGKADARTVASFIRISSTEGQVRGRSNGRLPEGFLPIRRTGVTGKLHDAAQTIADAVEAQQPATPEPTGEPTAEPTTGPDPSPGDGGGPGLPPGGGVDPLPAPGASAPPTAVPTAAPTVTPAAAPMPPTQAVGSGLAGNLLPALVLLAAVGFLATSMLRVVALTVRRRR
ncbi:hypothetical protein [Nocardioides sp.]|uniref:hypothetical protein n=1 Tax=Nocardioides sp. TaxID=35761 RepID=UPI0027348E32|nr:hypothetical protein [Nocardioides sp.]MDP3891512.1 hypothetical protein [Nocardioides sp.]